MMNRRRTTVLAGVVAGLVAVGLPSTVLAQPPSPAPPPQAPAGRGSQPTVVSPEVMADRTVAFRVYAPKAEAIRLSAGDIQGLGQNTQLTKSAEGVWSLTVGPVAPGAYRYNFNIDGVATVDPRNPATSESNNNTWSLVNVPGSAVMDTKNVPHGAVAEIPYFSKSLNRERRLHVYTPPGYQSNSTKYPVFYLLHGAGDSDDSWTTVGRAGFILDNLIAAGKAKPMIIVMTAGHTNPPTPPAGGMMGGMTDEFVKDFVEDVMPLVEKTYRTVNDRANRAIAGLSMGGHQTLYVALPRLDKFAYVGVFSSGLIGQFGATGRGGRGGGAPAPPPGPSFEEANQAALDNPAFKKGLKLLSFSTGKEDFLLDTTKGTVEMLKKHGFQPVFHETEGGHTWVNWRDYLESFSAQLFQ